MKKYLPFLLLITKAYNVFAQQDSTKMNKLEQDLRELEKRVTRDEEVLNRQVDKTFYLFEKLGSDSLQQNRQFTFSGYLEFYGAKYTDSINQQFQKFPTSAPRSNQLGLNMLYLSMNYQRDRLKAKIGLHWGDIAASAWSQDFNLIQEANVAYDLGKRFTAQAGFFRTHIGIESIQPRENLTISLATTTYFEPYYLSGLKLDYKVNKKFLLELNAFNGFNTFVENNNNKAVGFSAVYLFDENAFVTLNSLFTDESSAPGLRQNRLYNNLYFVVRRKKFDAGLEYNYGLQQNTGLRDSTATAAMTSFLAMFKYKFKKTGVYARFEYFDDPDEILTGPVENEHHQLVGLNIKGITVGAEYKIQPTAYIRLETRGMQTPANENIFNYQGKLMHQRLEAIASVGCWF